VSVVSAIAAIFAVVAIRLGGSAAYATLARRGYESPPRGVLFATLLREGVGFAGTGILALAAALAGALLSNLDAAPSLVAPLAVVAQVLLRFVAWLVTLVIAFDPERRALGRSVGLALGGVAVSFLLDLPVALLSAAEIAYLLRDTRFC
jgi:hypothetical protein